MRYSILHTTTYTYSQPVTLAPHTVRLRPRCDGHQTLECFGLEVSPQPLQQAAVTDLDGNAVVKLWFAPEAVTQLVIGARSQVETHLINAFSYILESWAQELPIDYPSSLAHQLKPYLIGHPVDVGIDPGVVSLVQEIGQQVNGNVSAFLTTLNQRIYQSCESVVREVGNPYPAGFTWAKRMGSCRDLAVLMMECCRAVGLAARFVSGYQEGDRDQGDRHLHAWMEVYLPGAGWRGYDPMHGLAVSDRHIALVASTHFGYAAPILGNINQTTGVQSQMDYALTITSLDALAAVDHP
jgi:transglutaminase-like putative cysteine protease